MMIIAIIFLFYQAYRHNLETLKTFHEMNFPFSNYIIDVKNEINAPKYINNLTEYDLTSALFPFLKLTKDELDKWFEIYDRQHSEADKKRMLHRFNIGFSDFVRERFEEKRQIHYSSFYGGFNVQNRKSIILLSNESWISAKTDFGFNESQLLAFKAALTEEFVVIQGPPGNLHT